MTLELSLTFFFQATTLELVKVDGCTTGKCDVSEDHPKAALGSTTS